VICTAGSDGKALIWRIKDNSSEGSSQASQAASRASYKLSYDKLCSIDHGDSQLYSVEPLNGCANYQLLTAVIPLKCHPFC
jgi:hypothetical protein